MRGMKRAALPVASSSYRHERGSRADSAASSHDRIDPFVSGKRWATLLWDSPSAGASPSRLLRETGVRVSRIRARRCRKSARPRSARAALSQQFPFSLYASDCARSHTKAERDRGSENLGAYHIPPSRSPSLRRFSIPLTRRHRTRVFFSSRDLPRVTRARYYIGRSVGRSRGLLPLSGEVCQEFIESIGDIGQLIPVARLGISWTTTNAHIRLPTTNISHNYREMRFIGADLLIWRTFTHAFSHATYIPVQPDLLAQIASCIIT